MMTPATAEETTPDPKDRLDLEPYVYPYDEDWYPMPSKMLLVADPALIPDEMLKALLTWNGDGESMAMVTDRPVEWRRSAPAADHGPINQCSRRGADGQRMTSEEEAGACTPAPTNGEG